MKKYRILALSVLIVVAISLLLMYVSPMSTANDDKYNDFEQLSQNEIQGEDYSISFKVSNPDILLLAIHGGGIEPGTSELAEQVAEEGDFSYYTFNGIKSKDNADLHITSTIFDESKVLEIAGNSEYTLSFHGYDEDENKHTYVGGLDEELRNSVKNQLKNTGFSVSDAPKSVDGKETDNIVNKNKQGKGVQLEISTMQRKAFFTDDDFSSANRKNKTEAFYAYTNAIQKALNK